MRSSEHFLGRDVRIAGNSVLRRRRAPLPLVPVGEPDRQIRSRPAIAQGVKLPGVQPFRPPAESGIVRIPGRNRVVVVDAGRGEDRLRQPADGDVVLVAGKDPLRPRGRRIGDDVPIDVEARDLLERRPIGDRIGFAGARDLGRVLVREQHRVLANDGEPGGIGGESLGDAFMEPAWRAIEARLRSEAIARERHLLVGEDGRHQASAGLVSLGDDRPRERQRSDWSGEEEVLLRLQPQSNLDRRLRQPEELGRVDRRKVALMGGHGGSGKCWSSGRCAKTIGRRRGSEKPRELGRSTRLRAGRRRRRMATYTRRETQRWENGMARIFHLEFVRRPRSGIAARILEWPI